MNIKYDKLSHLPKSIVNWLKQEVAPLGDSSQHLVEPGDIELNDATKKLIEKTHSLCKKFSGSCSVLFLGRDVLYPIALEGALKLKEISYIHAEGYASGELKHGPIALVDKNMSVVALNPSTKVFEKTLSNLEEVKARSGKIILLTDYEIRFLVFYETYRV